MWSNVTSVAEVGVTGSMRRIPSLNTHGIVSQSEEPN